MSCSDLLILLSDVDGLYSTNPENNTEAKFIKKIDEITPEIEDMASGSISKVGSGGMITKRNKKIIISKM